MDRKPLYGSWKNFVTGVFVGLVIATPALALPPDLPIKFDGDMQFYGLVGFGLLLVALLVMRTMRKPVASPDGADAPDVPASYSTRFFPGDRPIALE